MTVYSTDQELVETKYLGAKREPQKRVQISGAPQTKVLELDEDCSQGATAASASSTAGSLAS